MRDLTNYNLLGNNTFNIDVSCRRFVEIESPDEAKHFFSSLTDADRPLLIIGGGSNLLFTKDYDHTIVRSQIKGIDCVSESANDVLLRCGSGEQWDDVVNFCVKHGYYGAENLSLIPGDVGASAVQNIGAYGAEVKNLIAKIEAVDTTTGKEIEISSSECQYGYRMSRFKTDWRGRYFITHVTYRLQKTFKPNIDYGRIREQLAAKGIAEPNAADVREAVINIRMAMLPDTKVLGNAGSFFVNPVVSQDQFKALQDKYPSIPYYIIDEGDNSQVKIPAGWLIEQCGWKGRTLGNVGVHERQALVLVNRGGARGNEIVELCQMICNDVNKKFGIEIKPEVNII